MDNSIEFDGTISAVTEMCFSYAGMMDRTLLKLPQYAGRVGIPGRSLRGCWRHCGGALVMRKLNELGIKLTMADWYFILLGGILQEGSFDYNILTHRPLFDNHPFVGVWGCMQPAILHGRIQVEIAMADSNVQPLIMPGQRTDPVQRGEITESMLADPPSFAAYVAKLQTDADDRSSRRQRQADRRAGKTVEEDVVVPKVVTSNLPFSREMIPRGTVCQHHVSLRRNPSDLHLGMFLVSLVEFAADPYVGAQSGVNAGLVDLHYNVTRNGKHLGTIESNGRTKDIVLSGGLQSCVDAFWQEFPTLNFALPEIPKRKQA